MPALYLIIAFVLNASASIFLKLQAMRGMSLKPLFSLNTITHNKYFIIALSFEADKNLGS